MERCKLANSYHDRGFNCCQSVVAAFSDLTGLSEQESMNFSVGFCGASSGAIMVLGLMKPVDMNDPVGSKKRVMALSKELQKRFFARFGALRCSDLLKNKAAPDPVNTPAAYAMGITGHCSIMIVTAVEIVEEMLSERA